MGCWNRVEWTAVMDAEIRRVYERCERGGNKRLAARFDLQPGLVSARAARLGLAPLICTTAPKTRPQSFHSDELALIRAHLGEALAQIRARLYRKGYSRSLSSIASVIARHRQRGDWPSVAEMMEDRDQLTMQEVCTGLGVNDWQVERWIKRGLLRAGRITGQPLLTFRRGDLRKFLLGYPGHWDHRPADRWFLLDLLCGDAAARAANNVLRADAERRIGDGR